MSGKISITMTNEEGRETFVCELDELNSRGFVRVNGQTVLMQGFTLVCEAGKAASMEFKMKPVLQPGRDL